MRIGELAKRAGVNLQTVRFYERRGLLRKPSRTRSGYRDYERADLENLAFIKWCQKLGFTLKEVRQLLTLHGAVARLSPARLGRKSGDLDSIVCMAEEKIGGINERIKALNAIKRQLQSAIDKLRKTSGPVCPAGRS